MKIINYNKIYANIKKIKENKNLMIVLKDDAYNFDLEKVCVICLSLGVKNFAVRSIEEAIIIRNFCKEANILLLGKMPECLSLIKEYNILVTVNTKEEKEICINDSIDYHVEVKTSMNRFGVEKDEIPYYITDNLKGIYIHTPLSCEIMNTNLLNKFKSYIEKYSLNELLVHIGGSSFLKVKSDYTYRIACDIYKGAISFEADILYIRRLKENEFVGYDHKFKLTSDSLIAICNVGYVDGLSRHNDENYVFINDRRYYFVGYKCMDQSFILIDENVRENDKVEIIGPNISEDNFCKMNNIILHQMYLRLK